MKRTVERIEMKRIGGGADVRELMSRIAQRIPLISDCVKRRCDSTVEGQKARLHGR